MMKKMMTILLGLVMMSMLAACGSEETFTFGTDQAMNKAELFVAESGSMNEIVEVVDTYEYETEEGAKGVIFEVRLGKDNMTVASTDFVKVWKNNSDSKIQANWTEQEELEEKKNLYQ